MDVNFGTSAVQNIKLEDLKENYQIESDVFESSWGNLPEG